ncbi:helix-turn-helix domain-containing protein [Streptomyces diastaticus]|uniref:HTH cro/C1-type domain-containing protein n=1 Tax=Streptomyces griseus TaxID=1911 RepID=A0A380P987_STRGR|nr:helix-turn-helix domain-containing protein [Streptomyces sp. SID8455]SUP61791.1 Uncharacterised protein [Streptomyces griseus]
MSDLTTDAARATTLGHVLGARLRIDAGASLHAVARRLRISHNTIGRIERGLHPPREDQIARLLAHYQDRDDERHAAAELPGQDQTGEGQHQVADALPGWLARATGVERTSSHLHACALHHFPRPGPRRRRLAGTVPDRQRGPHPPARRPGLPPQGQPACHLRRHHRRGSSAPPRALRSQPTSPAARPAPPPHFSHVEGGPSRSAFNAVVWWFGLGTQGVCAGVFSVVGLEGLGSPGKRFRRPIRSSMSRRPLSGRARGGEAAPGEGGVATSGVLWGCSRGCQRSFASFRGLGSPGRCMLSLAVEVGGLGCCWPGGGGSVVGWSSRGGRCGGKGGVRA